MEVAEFLRFIASHQETLILTLFAMAVFAVGGWTVKTIGSRLGSKIADWKHNRAMKRYSEELEEIEGPNGFL